MRVDEEDLSSEAMAAAPRQTESTAAKNDESLDEVMDDIFGAIDDENPTEAQDPSTAGEVTDLNLDLDLDLDLEEVLKDAGADHEKPNASVTLTSGSATSPSATQAKAKTKAGKGKSDTTWVSLDSSEKDNFLSWLGEDEGADDAQDGKSGSAMRRDSRSATIESTASESGLSFSLEASSSLTNLLNASPGSEGDLLELPPMTDEEMADLHRQPPNVFKELLAEEEDGTLQDRCVRWLFPEGKAEVGEEVEQAIEGRLKVLLELDLADTSPLTSALAVGDHGLVYSMPSSLRFACWLKLLCTKSELSALSKSMESADPDPVLKPFDPTLPCRDAYLSLLPEILNAAGISASEEAQRRVEGILAEFSRLRLQSRFNPLIAHLLCVLLRASGEPLRDAQLVQALVGVSDRWGGEKGNWSSTGLMAEPPMPGVGGLGFSSDAPPSVQMRRHLLLRQLLFLHDPALALHLDARISSWDIRKSENVVDPPFRRIALLAQPFYPSVPLFGLLAVVPQARQAWQVPADSAVLIWDAMILKLPGFHTPQTAGFFLAAALLLLSRDELLRCDTNDALRKLIDTLPKRTFAATATTHAAIWCAAGLATASPLSLCQRLEEDELLITLPGAQRADFSIGEEDSQHPDENHDKGGIKKNHSEESQTETKAALSTKPKSSTASSWLPSNVRQLLSTTGGKSVGVSSESAVPLGDDAMQKLAVFYSLDKNPGLVLTSTKSGLTVKRVEPGSEAARSCACAGDLVMAINGHFMLNSDAAHAQAFLALQDRPVYCILSHTPADDSSKASALSKGTSASGGHGGVPLKETNVPGLRYRLLKYYLAHNTNKLHAVDKILDLYHGQEAVLLQELRVKYKAHVAGDPHILPASRMCPAVSAKEVVQSLFEEEERASAPRVFVVDCRTRREMDDTGSFPTAFKLDPGMTRSDVLSETLQALRGKKHICLMGGGDAALLEEYHPRAAREVMEQERRRLDHCALYLLRKGFPLVSIVEGGMLGCYMAIVSGAYTLQDCLVKADPSASIRTSRLIKRYENYMRFKQGRGMSTCELLQKVVRLKLQRKQLHSPKDALAIVTPFDGPSLQPKPAQLPNVMANFSKYLSSDGLKKMDPTGTKLTGSTAKWPTLSAFNTQGFTSVTRSSKEAGSGEDKAGGSTEKGSSGAPTQSQKAWKAWGDMTKALPSKQQLSETLNTAIHNSSALLSAAAQGPQSSKSRQSGEDTAELYSVDDAHGRRAKVRYCYTFSFFSCQCEFDCAALF